MSILLVGAAVTLSRKICIYALTFAMTGACVFTPPGLAQVVSPSPKTRTFLAPKEDYFQQVTKGHPFRWFDRDMAVRVLIEPGAGIVNFRPEFEKILRESFHEWETNSNSRIKFRFVSESPADITCRFVAELPKQEPLVAGVTSYQTSPHHMDSALITIKTQYGAKPLDIDLMRGVCLHEIGHALGLVNHSLDPHDVMYPILSIQKALSARDVKTIQLLYGFEPPSSALQISRPVRPDPNYPFGLIPLSSDEYDAFSRQIVAKLLKQFRPFSKGPTIECCVSCLVDSDGKIFNYRIFQESNNQEFDQKVLDCLLSALPLPPAPEKLRRNRWAKTPVALSFRSDGWVVPFVEPDARQSDWLQTIEEPRPDEMMKQLAKEEGVSPRAIDSSLEPWIVEVSRKAHGAWMMDGSGKTEVVVGLRKNGRVAHLVILQSSGSEAFDKSVLNACMAAEPYPAAPGSAADTIEVNLLFEH